MKLMCDQVHHHQQHSRQMHKLNGQRQCHASTFCVCATHLVNESNANARIVACRRLTDDKPSLGSPASASKAASLRATPHIPILTPLSPKHSHSHSQADRLKMPKLNLSCSAGLSAVQLGHNSQVCNRCRSF